MSASTRRTVSVRLTERQLEEVIRALEDVDLQAMDTAGEQAIVAALEHCRAALQALRERLR